MVSCCSQQAGGFFSFSLPRCLLWSLCPRLVRRLCLLPGVFSLNPGAPLTFLCFSHCRGLFRGFGAVFLGAGFSQQPFRAAEAVCPEKTRLELGNLEGRAPQQCDRRVYFFCCLLLGLILPEIVAHVKHFHQQFQYHKHYSWQQHLAHFLSFFAISGRKLSLHFFCLYLPLSPLNTDSTVSAPLEPVLGFCLCSPTAGSPPVPPVQPTSSSSSAGRSHPVLSLCRDFSALASLTASHLLALGNRRFLKRSTRF